MTDDIPALIARITTRAPDRELNAAVARALGWTTGPNTKGWKVVQPTGYIGGMVVPPREDSAPADAWFDPKGRERGLADKEDSLPAFLTSLDAALGAAPFDGRADLLRRALDAHARWLAESGRDDAALGRLPAFVVAEVLAAR
ncbi:hypothetical protein [Azospirillum sp.]|uniref:hypothetical protein n=1 Tax=Azospirillum sp. TaxID=34012 RepID=UPI003D743779